ncbi:MAG: hypothetical protein ABEJ98_05775 [Candidatus Nanohaloarchaea archaeon]
MEKLVLAALLISVVFTAAFINTAPLTVEEAVEKTGVNRTVEVAGTVQKGRVICTMRACPPGNSTCNSCSASLILTGENASIKLRSKKKNLGCTGTEASMNCTVTPGKRYVFTGRVQERYGETVLIVEGHRQI